jgi:glycosyltransferase involved in cell wall biosynthesis
MAKLVTVIVPCYNAATYILECLDSIVSQQSDNFDLVIADNASEDGTLAIIETWRKQAPMDRIAVYSHKKNIGMYANLNFLCEKSTGDYIKVVCADDLVSPALISSIEAVIGAESPKIPAVGIGVTIEREKLDSEIAAGPSRRIDSVFEILGNPEIAISLAGLCLKRTLFRDLGYYGSGDLSGGYSLDMTVGYIFAARYGLVLSSKVLYYERRHGTQSRKTLNGLRQLPEIYDLAGQLQEHARSQADRDDLMALKEMATVNAYRRALGRAVRLGEWKALAWVFRQARINHVRVPLGKMVAALLQRAKRE